MLKTAGMLLSGLYIFDCIKYSIWGFTMKSQNSANLLSHPADTVSD